ncbi:unnamed protein product [Triticum turgidum subsp. durum]|uniref:Protein kinase domain-containing protein n=1 Tax=Triticum turgidum subsp. durum TaxID=4567 RepID=A0A9R0RC51_TRITD|nr:unnamed protein product [Triticum turgidum subsp. durum]
MDVLGNTASVAQLVGTVGRLISKIIDAARTARQNKRECEYLTVRLSVIGEVLPRLPQRAEVKRSLTELGKTLGEAHQLVLACQNWSTARQLIVARRHADSLKEVNGRIDSHIGLLNLVFTTSGSGDQTRPPNHIHTDAASPGCYLGGPAAPVRLTWAQIAAATDYFADELSRRSSEVLYKGRLRDGTETEVAVKVLSKNGRQDVEGAVVAEVEILFPLRHPHIVRLVGWCSEEQDRIIVYHHEHMSNGTLRDHLLRVRVRARLRGGSSFSSSPVRSTWKARVEVLLGASRAIEHLHRCGVIHRNVTSFNILLDGSWAPRLSGFGQAILLAAPGDQVDTEVVGTPAYVDPEYRRTECMDSVLLAIRNRKLRDVMVRRPAATPRQLEALELVAHTAECCLFSDGNDRPAMSNVVANLARALTIINTKQSAIS